jgi:hypothetical protein
MSDIDEDDHNAGGLLVLPNGRYLHMYSNHGNTAEAAGSGTPVPEPATWLLTMWACLGGGLQSRRQRRI